MHHQESSVSYSLASSMFEQGPLQRNNSDCGVYSILAMQRVMMYNGDMESCEQLAAVVRGATCKHAV